MNIRNTTVEKSHTSARPAATGSFRSLGPISKAKKAMRPHFSLPRAARHPSPRILFYASDSPAGCLHDLALATALAEDLPDGFVVLTSAREIPAPGSSPRVEVVDLHQLTPESSGLPLARARLCRLRRKRLATLFDLFLPDLVVLDLSGPEAESEAGILAARAQALRAAALVMPADWSREHLCNAVRAALAERERGRR